MPNETSVPDERGRVRSTKEIAQRLDYGYFKKRHPFGIWKSRLTWAFLAIAALAAITFALGAPATRSLLSPGPVSSPHALFAARCETCHSNAFSQIPNSACLKCHDGPSHPAKDVDQASLTRSHACIECHIEHRGSIDPKTVSDGNCTVCHSNLVAHASGVTLKNVKITAFRPGLHPEFSPKYRPDFRPLKLNHAAHLPATAKMVQQIRLPMRCADCHMTDRNSPTGNLIPVAFDQHCARCHARELEFDVYELLKTPVPAPHTEDPRTIHLFIASTYQRILAENPSIIRRPLGNDVVAQPNAAAWLDKVIAASEDYLFHIAEAPGEREGKCGYCHEFAGHDLGLPIIAKVNRIQGRYQLNIPDGEPWLLRSEFSHRTHRSILCESCHTKAPTSTMTADVLIPVMKACLPCHGDSHARLDRCSECHQFHNKNREREERRSTNKILSLMRIRQALDGAEAWER